MVLSVKARLQQLDEASGPNETRRFLISPNFCLKEFCKKLEQIFPSLSPNTYKLYWKDEENDDILISSDEELAVAISQAQNDLLKVFFIVTSKPAPKSPAPPPPSPKSPEKSSLPKEPQQQKAEPTKPAAPSSNQKPKAQGKSPKSDQVFHVGVLCDGCDNPIWGYRYKCMECDNYDLCSACNEKNVHPNHNMWKFASPPDNSFWTFMTVSDTLRRFFGLVSGGLSHATSGSRHGRRGRNCRWTNGNAPSSANNSGSAKPAGGEKPQSNQSQEDLLRGVGETVAAMLDPLGINVDVDVEHSNGEREHIHSTKEARTEPKQTTPCSAEPATATFPPEFAEWSEPIKNWYQTNIAIPPSSLNTDNADTPLPELLKTSLATQSASVQTISTNQTSNTSTEVQTDFRVDCHTIPKLSIISLASTSSEGASGGEAKIEKDSSVTTDGSWTVLNEKGEDGQASLDEIIMFNHPEPQGMTSKDSKPTETQPQPAPISPRTAAALAEILSMGFNNENGWLTRMVEENNGDVAVVLDKLLSNMTV